MQNVAAFWEIFVEEQQEKEKGAKKAKAMRIEIGKAKSA
jgi:hypothetical protein